MKSERDKEACGEDKADACFSAASHKHHRRRHLTVLVS